MKQGVKGFKIAPYAWIINVDDDRVLNLLDFLWQTNLPVIPALQRFPDLKLVFAHSGLEQNDQLIEILKQSPATFSDK
jgi:predicted TIM-barrel fold metal-dependent hydrolase